MEGLHAWAHRQIEEARRQSRLADKSQPRAAHARFDPDTRRIELELDHGYLFAFPVEATQGLSGAPADLVARIEVVDDGYSLHWEELDADLAVPGLLAGRLGSRVWMREHARRAGSVKSEAKARAARANGRKGGRPKGS